MRSLGRSSGSELDKCEEFNIDFELGPHTGAPYMSTAYCSFDCLYKESHLYGDHTLFVGEVVAITIEEEAVRNDGILDIQNISTLLYLRVDHYITTNQDSLLSLKKLPFYYKSSAFGR